MIRIILAFFMVWGLVFFGFGYFWHTSREEKFDMVRNAMYSFATAFVAFALLTALVVLF